MGLVNKLLLLYEECRAEGRDVHLSIELRDRVEFFFLWKHPCPSSTSPLPSGGSKRRRRRQQGPRIRNGENDVDAVLPRRGRAPATPPRRGPSPALYLRRGRDIVEIPRRGQDDQEIPISGRSAQVLPRRGRATPALPRRGLVSKEAEMSQRSLGEVYTPNRSQREVKLHQLSLGEDKKPLGPQHRPPSMSEIPQIDVGLDMSQSVPSPEVPEGDLRLLVPDPATDPDQIYIVCTTAKCLSCKTYDILSPLQAEKLCNNAHCVAIH